jgi:hypothetical protein
LTINHHPKAIRSLLLVSAAMIASLQLSATAIAQTSAFSYQGVLSNGGIAANGSFDLQFRLLQTLCCWVIRSATTIFRDDVPVANGVFSVTLDFGVDAFSGPERFLEIAVRPGNSNGSFTTLSPLQPILSVPYAVTSRKADVGSQSDRYALCSQWRNWRNLGGGGKGESRRGGEWSERRHHLAQRADHASCPCARRNRARRRPDGSGAISAVGGIRELGYRDYCGQ